MFIYLMRMSGFFGYPLCELFFVEKLRFSFNRLIDKA